MARVFGLPVEVITPADVAERVPQARVDDLVGGVFLPGDGVTNPVDTTRAFAKGARAHGVTILENAKVERIITDGPRAVGVEYTVEGETLELAADVVVNAAGMWGRELGDAAGAIVPLHAAEHFYIVTEAVDGISPSMPVLRDQDGHGYFKEDAGKLLVGWFEPVSKPWGMARADGTSGIPESFSFHTLPPDVDHVAPLLEAAAHRMPLLEETGIQLFFNGPESFTPDERYLLGESPEVKGSSSPAASTRSASSQRAEREGARRLDRRRPPTDGPVGRRRPAHDALPEQPPRTCRPQLRDARPAVRDALALPAASTARGVRRSALHERLAAAGACFGEVAGWERANWFAPAGCRPEYEYSYGRQNWFEHWAAEHRAVREQVGVFDLRSFGKFQVQGPDAGRCCTRSAPTTWRCRWARSSTRSGSTSGARSRQTSPSRGRPRIGTWW